MRALTTRQADVNLAALELAAFRKLHADGLEDIAAGIGAVLWYFSKQNALYALAIVVLALWLLPLARRRVTYPRTGYFRIKQVYRDRRLLVVAICELVYFAVLMLLMVYTNNHGLFIDPRSRAVQLGITLLGASLVTLIPLFIGVYTGMARWYLYAAAFIASVVALWSIGADEYVGLIVAGVLACTCGVTLFARFIRNNPIIKADVAADDTGDGGAR